MIRPIRLSALLVAGLFPAILSAAPAYDATAPVPALPDSRMPAPEPLSSMGATDWRAANDSVGAFTRGHIDILRWEAANQAPATAAARPDGSRLSAAQAARVAFANRPDLFATSDTSAAERARADIAAVSFARDVSRAWITAVAAEQTLQHARQALDATETGTELAMRMTRAGNWGQDRALRQRLALHEATREFALVTREAFAAREALVRLAGLWGDAAIVALPDRLPDLPSVPLSADGLEATALQRHPLLPLAAIDADRAQRAQGERTLNSWQELSAKAISGVIDSQADDVSALEQPVSAAPMLDLRRAGVGHDASRAARLQGEATGLAVKIRSHVREAYHQYRIAHDLALQAQEVARLSGEVQEDMVLRYNGMLKSTWDLLSAARERVNSEAAAVQAQRDFWLAHANLQAVLAGADYLGPDAIGGASVRKNEAGGH